MDPRNYQIVALGTFALVGFTRLGFQIELTHAIAIVLTALVTQLCLFGACGPVPTDAPSTPLTGQAKSALISSMSLVLLLRTDVILIAIAAASIAIAAKRFIRLDGSHFFNPSAFALVLVTSVTPHAYISPGQWGALGLAAFAIVAVGLVVVTRAQRLDVALAFLITFASIVIFRGMYLGDPIEIALHQLQSGAVLLFAFFMITDPKTTPVSRRYRLVFGVLTACLTALLQFGFYISSAAIISLVVLAPLVPVLNLYTRKNTHVKKTVDYCSSADVVRI